MKEITITIPDDSTELITELVERLGGIVGIKNRTKAEKNNDSKRNKKKGDALALFGKYPDFPLSVKQKKENIQLPKKTKKTKKEKIDHTYLFGKWKDFDIDAEKLRDELWRRD